jgi:hypothetical protein
MKMLVIYLFHIHCYIKFEVFKAVTMNNASSGMLRGVALVRTDDSEEFSGSIIRVARIGELGKTLALFLFHRFLSP